MDEIILRSLFDYQEREKVRRNNKEGGRTVSWEGVVKVHK